MSLWSQIQVREGAVMRKNRTRLGLEALETRLTPNTTLYWVGGDTGSEHLWSDKNNWATTSGGATHPGASPNSSTIDVVFDNNSSTYCVTPGTAVSVGNINTSNYGQDLDIDNELDVHASTGGSAWSSGNILFDGSSSNFVLESGSLVWSEGNIGFYTGLTGYATGNVYITGGSTFAAILNNSDQFLAANVNVGSSPNTETNYAGTFTENYGGFTTSESLEIAAMTGQNAPVYTVASGGTWSFNTTSNDGLIGGILGNSIGAYFDNQGTVTVGGTASGDLVHSTMAFLNEKSLEINAGIQFNITSTSTFGLGASSYAYYQYGSGGQYLYLDGNSKLKASGNVTFFGGTCQYDNISQTADSTDTIEVTTSSYEVEFAGTASLTNHFTVNHNVTLNITGGDLAFTSNSLIFLNQKTVSGTSYWGTVTCDHNISLNGSFDLTTSGGKPTGSSELLFTVTNGSYSLSGQFYGGDTYSGDYSTFTVVYDAGDMKITY